MPDARVNPVRVEQPPLPEQGEAVLEKSDESLEHVSTRSKKKKPRASDISQQIAVAQSIAPSVVDKKDETLQRIEEILAEDLAPTFKTLSVEQRKKFKEEGERVALFIRDSVRQGKLHAAQVLQRIQRWFLLIVDKARSYWWLTQEAYKKSRKIMVTFS